MMQAVCVCVYVCVWWELICAQVNSTQIVSLELLKSYMELKAVASP